MLRLALSLLSFFDAWAFCLSFRPTPYPHIHHQPPPQESQHGPPQAPWGHLPAYGPELAYEWGWAPPPRVYVKRAYRNDKDWVEIPFCQHRRRTGFKVRARARAVLGVFLGEGEGGMRREAAPRPPNDPPTLSKPNPNQPKNSCWRTSPRCSPPRPTPSRTTPPPGPTSRYADTGTDGDW